MRAKICVIRVGVFGIGRPIFMTQTQICSLSRQFARRSAVHGDGATRYEPVPKKGREEQEGRWQGLKLVMLIGIFFVTKKKAFWFLLI